MLMAAADWFCALRIEQAPSERGAKAWLAAATAIDLGLIGFFKYSGLICSIFGMIGCRQIFLFFSMRANYVVENVYVGYPVGWACAALMVIIYYFVKIRPKYTKELKEMEQQAKGEA